MPTGYTAKLYEGSQTAKDFVLDCLKAFFFAYRDSDFDRPVEETITEYFGNEIKYKEKRLADLEADRKRWEKMTPEGALGYLQASHKHALKSHEENALRLGDRKKRFEEMKKKVSALKVGNDTLLKNLKKFMLEQLDSEDPYLKPSNKPQPPTQESAAEFLAHERAYSKERFMEEKQELADYKKKARESVESIRKLKKMLEAL